MASESQRSKIFVAASGSIVLLQVVCCITALPGLIGDRDFHLSRMLTHLYDLAWVLG